MSRATHIYERANNAANAVDPMVLASALDHIAKTAAKSRSQTRRIRWIELRATYALEGREYRDIDVDLPKDAGAKTPEKLGRKLAHEAYIRRALVAAAQRAEAFIAGFDDDNKADDVAGMLRDLRAALALAKGGAA